MPSPIGHLLGGVAAGHLIAGTRVVGPEVAWRRWRMIVGFGTLGALADIDFLFGTHSTYTHSIGAVLVVLAATFFLRHPRNVRIALAAAGAYGSHLLLDWLGDDTTPPIGILALWPFSDGFYQSDLHLFMAITRRYWLANFWTHNLEAVALEIALLGPLAALTLLATQLPSRTRSRQSAGPTPRRQILPSDPNS